MGDVITLIIKSAKSAVETIKNSSSKAKQGMFACVAVIAIIASLSFTGTRIAYNVNYSGHTIATVSSKKHFNDALQLIAKIVDSNNIEQVVEEPQFNTTVALNENLNNTQELANAIIDNTDEIVEASVLLVDGSVVARAQREIIDDAIDARLNAFNMEGAKCTSSFVENVICEDAYLVTSDLDSRRAVEGVVNSLSVVTDVCKTTDIIVPYSSTVQKTGEQLIGYTNVAVSGVSGVDRLTQNIVLLNGEVQSCVDVSTERVIAPVDEVIVKGTAKTLASAKQKQQAHKAGFIFPLPNGSWYVTSYYGDGRNHKGIDICADSGTSIYAALGGKVVLAGWNGNYGNCVIIEHENGLRTLYAHAKKVCCSVGDTVSQGEVIALVGSTGQSTANHLHFEVISGGKNIDPAPYINLD